MRKRWLILIWMLSLGSAGATGATALVSQDIVYVDGMPCNSLCQSYMAWSRRMSSTPPERLPKAAAQRATGMGEEKPKAASQPAANAAIETYAARTNSVETLPGDTAANSWTRTRQAPVAAETVVVEHVMPATTLQAPKRKANSTGSSNRSETAQPGDGRKIALASPDDADHLVALVMARPEIKSVSDLTGKNIATDDKQSASNGKLRRAIAAAGATEVQLSGGPAKALKRLISGEVPAAVLTLAYPEAAEWSPEIAGFKVFRIPLTPRSSNVRLEPAVNAAADPGIRKVQEQVAAATAFAEQVTAAAAVLVPNRKANDTDRSDRSGIMLAGDAGKSSPALPSTTDLPVAILMARAEIKSVSDLSGKVIAIGNRQSMPNDDVRSAIVAAGAAGIQLNESQAKAADRLLIGEVPAAVLTLVSPEAAEWFPEIAGFKVFRIPLAPRSSTIRSESAGRVTVDSPTARANMGYSHLKGGTTVESRTRTLQEQVAAATAVAEQVTAATAAMEQNADDASRSDRSQTVPPGGAGKTTSASPNNTDHLVALLMARPEVKSVSDLANMTIAIDDRHSASNGGIWIAIVAAGAINVQLSDDQTKAIDRVIGGEVPAAVVALVSADAAEWFPEIAGFKIFRIPLSPRSLKARL
jgi:hypothetical protein